MILLLGPLEWFQVQRKTDKRMAGKIKPSENRHLTTAKNKNGARMTETKTEDMTTSDKQTPGSENIAESQISEEASDNQITDKTSESLGSDLQTTNSDVELAKEACDVIEKKLSKHLESGIKEVGAYLIETFFDGDYNRAKAKEKAEASSKSASLHKVLKYFKESGPGTPSKSWLYQAIDYEIQDKEIKEYLEKEDNDDLIEKYNNFLPSYKITLLPIKDIANKIKIIRVANLEGLTVETLKGLITKEGVRKSNTPGILTIAKNPEKYEKDWEKKMSFDALKGYQYNELNKLSTSVTNEKLACQVKIQKNQEEIKKYENNITKFEALEKELPDIIKRAKEKSKPKGKTS
jgi:hypothetical protein